VSGPSAARSPSHRPWPTRLHGGVPGTRGWPSRSAAGPSNAASGRARSAEPRGRISDRHNPRRRSTRRWDASPSRSPAQGKTGRTALSTSAPSGVARRAGASPPRPGARPAAGPPGPPAGRPGHAPVLRGFEVGSPRLRPAMWNHSLKNTRALERIGFEQAAQGRSGGSGAIQHLDCLIASPECPKPTPPRPRCPAAIPPSGYAHRSGPSTPAFIFREASRRRMATACSGSADTRERVDCSLGT